MPFDGNPELFTTPSVADVLRRAKALIDTPEKWGQAAYPAERPAGGLLCVNLAINRSGGWDHSELSAADLFSVANGIPEAGNPVWNDAHGRIHTEVMAAFDKAIALAEQQS